MKRVARFVEDAVHFWKRGGFRGSFRFVRSRLFARTDTLLYELRSPGVASSVPEGWRIRAVASLEDAEGLELLRQAGGEAELRHFRRHAIAYVTHIGDQLVARCWVFPDHPLARWMGPNNVYFGCMFVQPPWRGQGIQGRLNAYLASLQPAGCRILMEVDPANIASQRGLIKGGSTLLGLLTTIVVLGRIVSTRIKPPAASGEAGS